MMDAGLAWPASTGTGPGGALRVMRLGKLAASGGAASLLLFTAARVVSSLRQTGHPTAGIQLSAGPWLATAPGRRPPPGRVPARPHAADRPGLQRRIGRN